MSEEERQFLLTTAWLFERHGQGPRARVLCEALVEDDPRDGVAAAALAQLQLEERNAEGALATLRGALFPKELERAAAFLETRALALLGRRGEAERRWRRYIEASKGAARAWVRG